MKRGYPFNGFVDKVENRNDSRAIATWFGVVFAGLSGMAGLGISAYSVATSKSIRILFQLHPNLLAVAIVSLLVVAGCVSAVIIDKWRLVERIRRVDTLSDCRILQMITMCHVKSPRHIEYAHRYWIEARNGFSGYFEMDFAWSSDMRGLSIVCRNPNHSAEIIRTKRIGVNRLRIKINDLSKGHKEVVEFSFVTDTTEFSQGEPFLGLAHTSNKFPRFNTFLGLMVDPTVAIASLYRERYFSPQVDIAIKSDSVKFDGQCHIWPVRPTPGWKTVLRWVYGEQVNMEHN